MPNFLDLPRELRDRILELVVAHRVDLPDIEDLSTLAIGRTAINDVAAGPWAGTRSVFYENEPRVNALRSIFTVNRQLRLEAKQALARAKLSGVHELDIIILDETNLIPTWIYAPSVTYRIETLKVTIRVANTNNSCSPKWQRHAGLETGIWSNTSYARSAFQSLVSIMLKADFRGKAAPECVESCEELTVKCLDINILNPRPPAAHRITAPWTYCHGTENYGRFHALTPEYVGGLLDYHVWNSPSTFHSTIIHGELIYVYINCAQLLFERVEAVILQYNGVHSWTYDMGYKFRHLGIEAPYAYGEKSNTFGEWMERIRSKRKYLGLST